MSRHQDTHKREFSSRNPNIVPWIHRIQKKDTQIFNKVNTYLGKKPED